MKSQKIPAVVKRTAFRVFVLVLTAVMLITSGMVNAQMFDRLQAMYDLAQQTFTLAPEEGVTVELSGMMPKGGSATAVPAETEDEDVIHAYDITIRYQDGREFEPDNDEPISVSFMSDQIAEALKDDETLEVAHIPDNGEEEDVALTSAGGDTATFEAESFSVYLIRTHAGDSQNHNPRRIYHFLSPEFNTFESDGNTYYKAKEYLFPNKVNEMVSVQAIRTGESLQEIVMPENKTNGVFYGWYVVQVTGTKEVDVDGETTTMYTYRWTGDSQERVSFNEPISFESDDDVDIYLAPVYARYRFLTFHQDTENSGSDNANIIVCRKLIILNDEHKCKLSIGDVRAPSPSPNKIVFVGWKYTHTEGDNYDQGAGDGGKIEENVTVNHEGEEIPTSITIEDTRNLGSDAPETSLIYDIWPIFKEARWVEFDSGGNGATYRPAQFILLDDDTTGFNNAPVKSGFTFDGWYFIDDNGESVMVTDENADILSNVNKQLTTGMSVNNGKLIMTSAAEESSANRIFRARWTPNDKATFAVIVWKQKVTDSKYAGGEGYPKKTYDFAGYYPNLTGLTTENPRDCTAYKNHEGNGKGFEDFTTTRTTGDGDANFVGFHFSEAVVSDNGYNQPEYKDKINPNNSTVVNVYYDRDLMHITFHYSTSPGGTQVGNYLYVATDGTDGDQYGYVNGEYVLLTTDATFYATSYSFSSKYAASTNNDAKMYGIVGGEYVLLDAAPVFNRTTGINYYIYTCVGSSTSITNNYPTKYGISSGRFVELSYSSWRNNWRYNGSNYTGPLYTRDSSTSATYTGKAYTLSGTTFTQTNDTTGTLYGIEDADGNFGSSDGKTQGDKVYRVTFANQYNYSYNGEAYTGPRYLRSDDNTFYDGKLYQKTENGFEETTDTTIKPLYGTRTERVYEELTEQDNTTVYTWYTSPTPSDETRYTGTRYIRYTRVSNYYRPYTLEWTGLYGSSFDQNNYDYPIEQRWTEAAGGGTGQTLLTSFTRVEGTASVTQYNLYQGTWDDTKVIYHLRQRLDGSYSRDDPDLCTPINIPNNHANFNIENKFEGFEVCAYGNTFSATGSGNGVMTVSDGDSINRDKITYIYHRRRSGLELMFNSNYTGGETHVIPDLLYGQSIAGYDDVYEPEEREHYTFAGWYEDSAGTQPFDFDTVIYSSKIVYAKWVKERYRINVDPNGGEMPLGSNTATFFNVDFDELVGQYADLRRNYVEDSNGDYVYANFQYDKVAGASGLGGSNLAAVYRKAFYIKKNEIEAEYNRVFTVDGVEYSYANSGLTFEEFKSCIDMNRLYAPTATDGTITYELVSWHKVRADGTVETLPFNFKDFVTEDTTIRARWFEHGGYSLAYDATSGGVTGDMVRNIDPIDQQRKYADKASVVVLYEPSNLRTVGQGGQEEEASEYIFRGWRIVDGVTQVPLEPGVFYDPGETMVLDASHADHQGVIHMKAYYEKRTATVRRPDSAAVTLNANSDTASVNEQGLAGDNKEYADIQNKAVKIERQIHNFNLELKNYIKNFTNTDGSKLLGWNTTATSDSYIPEFYADAEVGVNKQGALNAPFNINNLYAVWEPMVYLTLDNATTQAITFNLDFKEHDNSAYAGYVMAMTGEYDRVPFGEMRTDTITVTDNGSGSYSVTLQPDGKVQLVVPSGVLKEAEPVSYTVSGDYETTNTKNLYVYNSGSDSGVSIEKKDDNSWYLNNSHTTENPIPYTTTGTLVKGTQGRLVRFTETGDSSVQVNLTARYYDLETETWKNADTASGVNAELHFLHSNATVTETFSADGATTSATLPDNSTHTYRFGMSVAAFNDTNYKCIGWYMTNTAAPNTISVDGHASDPGEATIQPTLAIPTTETTYYALFVPYVSGPLEITHSQRNDSAGDSADEGLGLSVQYYTDPNAKTEIASNTGDKDRAASVKLYKLPNTDNVIIDEKNTAGHLVVTVSAKANDYSTYKATYRGQNAVSLSYDEVAECYKASFDATVANHFADSDTVKGLKVLKPINYYSVFSRTFEIIYTYTARDSKQKQYRLTGSIDSFDDFRQYVVDHTPYVRTLAGDTVWDIDNMIMNVDETGMHAYLNEVSAVRAHCSVTINEAGGYTPTVSVPYGETFTEELALMHKAPDTDAAGQTFAYWDIKNTDTDKHIANCYSPKFTFKVWNNYTITPVYQAEPEVITGEGRFITIDYIDTSRNPWGIATYSEDNDTTDRSQVTDKVVADVDITFVNNGDRIYDNLDEHGNNRYQLGVMFEVVGNTNDGSFDPKNYVNDDVGRLSRVTALLDDPNAKPSSTKKFGDMTCYYSKINISLNTVSDFNRSEFARSFNAGAVKNYVFRMYAYMVTPDGEKVLSDPHYMTFYGSATPQYALPASGE